MERDATGQFSHDPAVLNYVTGILEIANEFRLVIDPIGRYGRAKILERPIGLAGGEWNLIQDHMRRFRSAQIEQAWNGFLYKLQGARGEKDIAIGDRVDRGLEFETQGRLPRRYAPPFRHNFWHLDNDPSRVRGQAC